MPNPINVNINWDPIIAWIQKQGFTNVLLMAMVVAMYFYFNTRVEKLEAKVDFVTEKYIECEKSKLNMVRPGSTKMDKIFIVPAPIWERPRKKEGKFFI